VIRSRPSLLLPSRNGCRLKLNVDEPSFDQQGKFRPLFMEEVFELPKTLLNQLRGRGTGHCVIGERRRQPVEPPHRPNYVAAMNHGLERPREGFPLSLRLIREIHEIILSMIRLLQKKLQPVELFVAVLSNERIALLLLVKKTGN
jgi:hypothetical protein